MQWCLTLSNFTTSSFVPHSEALLLELLHIHNSGDDDDDDDDEDHPIKMQSKQNIASKTPSQV